MPGLLKRKVLGVLSRAEDPQPRRRLVAPASISQRSVRPRIQATQVSGYQIERRTVIGYVYQNPSGRTTVVLNGRTWEEDLPVTQVLASFADHPNFSATPMDGIPVLNTESTRFNF